MRELNADGHDYEAIALYTEPDRHAVFVREADAAYSLGSASFVDPADSRRKVRYLDYEALEHALRESGAEAVWVGWGFVAEHAAFADLCARLGVVFIGPSGDVMRALGDKIGSKRMAEESGVPVAPWSGGPVPDLDAARQQAERLGFPLMVKATAGGGGRGIRKVRSAADLADAFESARSEALAGFGDDTVFMERLLDGARHIEVQIVGDAHGHCWGLGVRDCTVQRRNQKVIEESPSPALTDAQEREICDAAARLGARAGYCGAGTVEFLYDPQDRVFSFMEVNARLQVEHPVTECTTGADLVKLQIHVAAGGALEGDPPAARGHAIEVRVNAEDPERGFAPTPGRIVLMRPPAGPGLRIDSGFVEGDSVAPEFDSMIAKVIAHGRDRNEALARLERALEEMRLAIEGGAGNKGFLLGLLRMPEVGSGEVDVGWLDRLAAEDQHLPPGRPEVALIQGAIDAYEQERAVEQTRFLATAARGRPKLRAEVGYDVELRSGGGTYNFRVLQTGPGRYRVATEGQIVAVEVEPTGPFEQRLRIGHERFRTLSQGSGVEQIVEVDGMPHRLSRDEAGTVRSPAPAVVLSIAVAEGDEVERGDRLAVLEAMKTELPVLAPCPGKVRQVLVVPNVQVDAGAALVLLDPSQSEEPERAADRARFDALDGRSQETPDPRARCLASHEQLLRLVLGYDVEPGTLRGLLDESQRLACDLPADEPELLALETEILAAFADGSALFERREAGSQRAAPRSAEESLLLYMRSRDAGAAGLTPEFVDRLQRALAHYGVDSLEPGPALEEALLWIWKAHERSGDRTGVVIAILQRLLEAGDSLRGRADERLHELLDRLVTVTQGRHQAVSDLAHEVRYRWFDRPFFESVREEAYADAARRLEALEADPHGPDRATLVHELVECTQPLSPRLLERFTGVGAEPDARAAMLEVMVRRYYRMRELADLRAFGAGERSFVEASYRLEGRNLHLLATHASWKQLEDAAEALAQLAAAAPVERDLVLDLYVTRPTAHDEPDAVAETLRTRLAQVALPRPVRRIVVVMGAPGGGRGLGALQHFTFRSRDGELVEDTLYRDLHPMMSKRLELWRLDQFDLDRLPCAEDVYLFHGTARENPKDQRLFAFAEVRDLTPVRDEHGRIVRLPHLEMMLMEALAGIRLFQSRRSPRQRLHWNRVQLFVWPPVEFGPEQLGELAHRLVPPAQDLGLQKIVVRARLRDAQTGALRDTVIHMGSRGAREVVMTFTEPADEPLAALSEYGQKVVRMRQRGLVYPYELIEMLAPSEKEAQSDFPPGEFQEYDLDEAGERLVPVERPPGRNTAKMVQGVIRNFTTKHPEGMARVLILGDPSREMGSFAEPECRRLLAAIALAREQQLPIDWFPISAGAKIAMDTGTENLDWTAKVLRALIEFTQDGGEVNVVIAGINVGGQSYWNAEATMLMHTRGILVMTPEASMVLTGKKALDYSGSVSAEDHQGIGGYERIMGPNGEAQYWAADVADACHILLRHYEHCYVAPGERFPRRAGTSDPLDRDVRGFRYAAEGGFERVGDIFGDERNPGRRKPFDVRQVMQAVIDSDHAPLERWHDMRHAEIAVVWDAHLGGLPVCLIGMESRPLGRLGFVPADGPDSWTAGTLFPASSRKIARAINAASGNRPVVLLANLSGFDGSPESLRRMQLEYGAEIGRAVVNFQGPMVFCVISRYHGGAYVVFSSTLNEGLEVAALEGSYASVIGGAPAAAVVFAGDVDRLTRSDPRLEELEREIAAADEGERGRLRARWHELFEAVRSEKRGEVAERFDGVHTVQRAREVGSLHHILPPAELRPYLIEAVERGIDREMARWKR